MTSSAASSCTPFHRLTREHTREVGHIDIAALPPHSFLECRSIRLGHSSGVEKKQGDGTDSVKDFNFAFLPSRGAVSEFGVFAAGAAFLEATAKFQSRERTSFSNHSADSSSVFEDNLQSSYPGIWLCSDNLENIARLLNILMGPDEQDMRTLAFYAKQTKVEGMNCDNTFDPVMQSNARTLPRKQGSQTTRNAFRLYWTSRECAMGKPKQVELHVVSNTCTDNVQSAKSGKAEFEEGRVFVKRELLKQATAAAQVLFLCECVGQLLRLDGESA